MRLYHRKHGDVGLIVQGGLYNTLIRALQQFDLADAFGATDIPLLVLNVTFPLVPEQVAEFCIGKRAVLVLEEGQPEFIEQEIATLLRRRDIQTPLHGKDLLPLAGEYSVEVIAGGLLEFVRRHLTHVDTEPVQAWLAGNPDCLPSMEAADEPQDHGTTPEQAGLHLCAPVDECPSAPPSGEHRAPVCSPPEGAGSAARSGRCSRR